MSAPQKVTICAVGDVLIDDDDPKAPFAAVQAVFDEADVVYGNCEGVYSDTPEFPPSTHYRTDVPMKNIDGLQAVGFNVLSCANNHIVDGGRSAMLKMLDELNRRGIATCGAGKDLEVARKPAIIERKGIRIAFLSYCSGFPIGYQAREGVPGLAQLRVDTVYRIEADVWQPGRRPEIVTIPWPEDLEMVRDDVRTAREAADIVIICHHGGVGAKPPRLLYERDVAHHAIDVGADVVLGHSSHTLRGVEFYKDRPIFYDIGHFVFQMRDLEQRSPAEAVRRWRASPETEPFAPRAGWPVTPFHPDSRLTGIVKLVFSGRELVSVSLVPCRIVEDGSVRICAPTAEDGGQVLELMRSMNREFGLTTKLEMLGNEVAVRSIQPVAGEAPSLEIRR